MGIENLVDELNDIINKLTLQDKKSLLAFAKGLLKSASNMNNK